MLRAVSALGVMTVFLIFEMASNHARTSYEPLNKRGLPMLGKARFLHALRLLLGALVLLWWAIHVLTWGAAILAYWPIWLVVLPLWALMWLGAKELLTKRKGVRGWLVALLAGIILATELTSLFVFDVFWVPPYVLVTSLLIVSLLKKAA